MSIFVYHYWRSPSIKPPLSNPIGFNEHCFKVEILDNDVCNRLYGIMTENMMCTSGNNGRGTCYGDSGGPAVVQSTDGTWVQVQFI